MARLYSNENFPVPTVARLRELGHDVLTIHETGRSGQQMPDEAVLDFAISEGRAVLTLNRRHFIRLHGERRDHAGIVVCTVDANFIALAERIHTALAMAGDLNGQLIRVNRAG